MRTPRFAHFVMIAVLASLPLLGDARAADDLREIKWADLMPPLQPEPKKPKTFFSGATPRGENAGSDEAGPLPPPPGQEGEWMSRKRYQPGQNLPPRIVTELNGKRVKIGGYVVPLDFEATTIKEFLLVPFVGACIHVPPPPANQIVYVKSKDGFQINDTFDPVTVIGTMKTETAFTGIADAGYTIDADSVERRTE